MKRIAFALYALALLTAVRALQHQTAPVSITTRRNTGGPYSIDKEAARQEQPLEPGRGRKAESPAEIPALGWKDVLFRVYHSLEQDRVMLIAAGSTFYLLLALLALRRSLAGPRMRCWDWWPISSSQATIVRTMFPAKKWQMRSKTVVRQMSVGMYARMAPGFGQAVKCCDFTMTVLQKASSRSFETERSKSGRRSCSQC